MFPRNAAAPEPIAIGAVIQIIDGAVQNSGCTVRIKPIGVAEADGGGTTAYSTDGIVLYTPTQAETNYTSFVLIAKKTGCIPVSITVVTTASSVPGRTMPADGSVTADVIAADAITEIQSGLATAANLTALQAVADKIATVIYGTVTGAGTATEVFTSAGYTVTVSVLPSGDRTQVVIT